MPQVTKARGSPNVEYVWVSLKVTSKWNFPRIPPTWNASTWLSRWVYEWPLWTPAGFCDLGQKAYFYTKTILVTLRSWNFLICDMDLRSCTDWLICAICAILYNLWYLVYNGFKKKFYDLVYYFFHDYKYKYYWFDKKGKYEYEYIREKNGEYEDILIDKKGWVRIQIQIFGLVFRNTNTKIRHILFWAMF